MNNKTNEEIAMNVTTNTLFHLDSNNIVFDVELNGETMTVRLITINDVEKQKILAQNVEKTENVVVLESEHEIKLNNDERRELLDACETMFFNLIDDENL